MNHDDRQLFLARIRRNTVVHVHLVDGVRSRRVQAGRSRAWKIRVDFLTADEKASFVAQSHGTRQNVMRLVVAVVIAVIIRSRDAGRRCAKRYREAISYLFFGYELGSPLKFFHWNVSQLLAQ